MNNKYLTAFLWIVFFQLVAAGIGLLTQPEISGWYANLKQSSLTPPNSVFPVVWTVLYVMLALVGYTLWHARKRPGSIQLITIFWFQMILNWLWSPMFFNFHLLGLALLCIMVITLTTFFLIYKIFSSFTYSAMLLTPYALWLCFAAYLNYFIWANN